jgi:hypothetical protein
MLDSPTILTAGGSEMKCMRYYEEKIISILTKHEVDASVPGVSH